MERSHLLQRCRSDRRKLFEFLLSSGLVKELRTPSGRVTSLSALDFDHLSADYVLDCLKSGGVVDVSRATKKYHDQLQYPTMIYSESGNSFYLVSSPDITGSPPRRLPPPANVDKMTNQNPGLSHQVNSLYSPPREQRFDREHDSAIEKPKDDTLVPIGLPQLKTGLSDDDLRETAYEILLAAILLSGVDIGPTENRKKEKSSKFFPGLKRKDSTRSQTHSLDRQSSHINIIRVQMQIAEAVDACMRRTLVQLAAGGMFEQIDLPQVAVGLLMGIFKSDFNNEKLYTKWKNRQADVLEELLYRSRKFERSERSTIKSRLAKIRGKKEWDVVMSPSQHVEVLSSIRQAALKLSSLPGHFGLGDETYYWTASYHLNIRLYEKLLFAVFDILDESQLIEEADAVLSDIRSTWPILGVTPKVHNVMYGWVLFQQFVSTGEDLLLDNAITELHKVISAMEKDDKETLYTKHLVCSKKINDLETSLSLAQAIFLSMAIWCDNKLQDYHLYFSQKPHNFRKVMGLASMIGIPLSVDSAEMKLNKLDVANESAARKIKACVESSIKAASRRASKSAQMKSKSERTHPLALLANELKTIVKRELSVFSPVLQTWLPECVMTSAKLLHEFYGERLKPFLMTVSSLSEDVIAVLPAAYMLEKDLLQLFDYNVNSESQNSFNNVLERYQIGNVSRPLILDWIIAQHDHVLEWTRRQFDIEDWEPLSVHQRHNASVVEVFRIIEETVAQFFGLNLPMDITHLQALLSVIYHCLDAYLMGFLNQLVEKKHLIPSAPPLTRFTETVIPTVTKKVLDFKVLDEKALKEFGALTVTKLCVRLNTLQYMQKQINQLESSIRESWALVGAPLNQGLKKDSFEASETDLLTHSEAIDELFSNTFDVIIDTAGTGIKKIGDLIGARVVFWDLRDMFLLWLYRGTVERSRLESFLPHLDSVLDNICGLIDEDYRDAVVLSIYRAVLEALVWVLLDGGPSRAFSDSDVIMMEEDLNILKEFFVAGGEGLPQSLVDQESKFVEEILALYSFETETLIQMLTTASELISMGIESRRSQGRGLDDAHTLLRVLCHKRDREASKFLKKQYELPMSSEYDDGPAAKDSALSYSAISELVRTTSFDWSKKSRSGFKSMKKRLQEATSEFRNVGR